jgi:hypothetical protein
METTLPMKPFIWAAVAQAAVQAAAVVQVMTGKEG